MKYEVTIGIPLFRAVEYIRDTMESALCQSFANIEYLIVDDRGDDGSIDLIMYFQREHSRGKDIHILRNERNMGVSYSRNRMIDEAQGNYLYFLDSDDKIEPDTIQKLYEAITRYQSDVAYASYDIIDIVNQCPRDVYQKESVVIEGYDKLAEYAFRNNSTFQVMACNCLISLAFLRQLGVRFVETQYWEDMAFTCDLALKVNKAVLMSDVTYHYMKRPGSLSHFQKRDMLRKDEIMSNVSVIGYLKKKCPELLGRPSLSYFCYILEMNSFYIVCHILKYAARIHPSFTVQELQRILKHPLQFHQIIRFKRKKIANLAFWLISMMPTRLFVPSIKLLGKLKKAL